MALDDQLSNMSLDNQKKGNDPVARSAMEGKAPTIRDVKQSLKVHI